ncbi:MAG: ATP-dependent 6-phosphofructokinase, partial [Planctomycetota bacterium]|nr:ATP-dependent 6-phosphofructokinase [Planctomycetota bacterium]
MTSIPRRIGVLTGGGDCPGLNAVLRSVTKHAIQAGLDVHGIEDGFLGLIENRVRELRYDDVSGILKLGGTILGTSNKANPLRFATGQGADGEVLWEDVTASCFKTIEEHGLEALVVLGGDGTMACAQPFAAAGIPVIGVPKTIDNDVHGTELTFGFQSAVEVATEALDRVHTTAESHGRALVVEVMGRNAGWIALHAGIAGGADVILIPEIPFRLDHILEQIDWRTSIGRRSTVICVAEGACMEGGEQVVHTLDPTSPDPVKLGGIGEQIAQEIDRESDVEARAVTLGHVQRGGSPVADDRVLGTLFGAHATRLLLQGAANRMVAWRDGAVGDVDITVPGQGQRTVPLDDPHVLAARS